MQCCSDNGTAVELGSRTYARVLRVSRPADRRRVGATLPPSPRRRALGQNNAVATCQPAACARAHDSQAPSQQLPALRVKTPHNAHPGAGAFLLAKVTNAQRRAAEAMGARCSTGGDRSPALALPSRLQPSLQQQNLDVPCIRLFTFLCSLQLFLFVQQQRSQHAGPSRPAPGAPAQCECQPFTIPRARARCLVDLQLMAPCCAISARLRGEALWCWVPSNSNAE